MKNPHVDQANADRADPMPETPIRRAAQNAPSPPQSVCRTRLVTYAASGNGLGFSRFVNGRP